MEFCWMWVIQREDIKVELSCQDTEDGLGEYVTIHITPEPDFSYVSFESNVPASSYLKIVTNILNTFNPGKFILTIFATKVGRESSQYPGTLCWIIIDLSGRSFPQRTQSLREIRKLDKKWYPILQLSGIRNWIYYVKYTSEKCSGLWSYIRSLLKNTILRKGKSSDIVNWKYNVKEDKFVFIELDFSTKKNFFSREELTFIAKYKRKINYSF